MFYEGRMRNIITIDGPASSGKGTVAKIIANRLGFSYLESGAIYRALGLWVYKNKLSDNALNSEVLNLIDSLNLKFVGDQVLLNGSNVTLQLREEFIGMLASKYSAIPDVRAKLLQFQRNFAGNDNLVTDGRDMGSIVFPNARLKIFLTASAHKRAERRFKQLHQLDKSVTIESILNDIMARDLQDSTREVAPLSYDSSFYVLDNSELTIDETINFILSRYNSATH